MTSSNLLSATEPLNDRGNPEPEKTAEDVINGLFTGATHLSHSSFSGDSEDCFWASPRGFLRYKLRDTKTTRAMIKGDINHTAVLEPDRFEEKFCWFEGQITPSSGQQKGFVESMLETGGDVFFSYSQNYKIGTTKTKPGEMTEAQVKSASDLARSLSEYIEWYEGVNGRTIITLEEKDTAMRIVDFLYEKNRASQWLLSQMTETEKKLEWEFGEFAPGKFLRWLGYADMVGEGIVGDLKFISPRVDPDSIKRKIIYGAMGRQAAHYTRGAGLEGEYYILAVNQAGTECTVMEIDKSDLDNAWERIEEKMEFFLECMASGNWGDSYDHWTSSGIYNSRDIVKF
jgi:hypothetical protein